MTTPTSTSLDAIASVAAAMGEHLPQVMFVGGTVTALYSLEGGIDVRPTIDVDCVVDVATTTEYYAFAEKLRTRGFEDCTEQDAPLCRFVVGGQRVDIMTSVDTAIGPANRWYQQAMTHPGRYLLPSGIEVLAVTPVYFVATKLEAFRSRGMGDIRSSHDLEDVLAVLAGLKTLRECVTAGRSHVETAVRRELIALVSQDAFVDAVYGHFEGDTRGQRHAEMIVNWFRALVDPPAGTE